MDGISCRSELLGLPGFAPQHHHQGFEISAHAASQVLRASTTIDAGSVGQTISHTPQPTQGSCTTGDLDHFAVLARDGVERNRALDGAGAHAQVAYLDIEGMILERDRFPAVHFGKAHVALEFRTPGCALETLALPRQAAFRPDQHGKPGALGQVQGRFGISFPWPAGWAVVPAFARAARRRNAGLW